MAAPAAPLFARMERRMARRKVPVGLSLARPTYEWLRTAALHLAQRDGGKVSPSAVIERLVAAAADQDLDETLPMGRR